MKEEIEVIMFFGLLFLAPFSIFLFPAMFGIEIGAPLVLLCWLAVFFGIPIVGVISGERERKEKKESI